MKNTASHRFHLLDALRGIAAIFVALRHFPIHFAHSLAAHNSYLAVDFFFCLSGFVVGFSYEKRLQTHLSLRDFLAARIIRLYPLSILATAIGLAYFISAGHIFSTVPACGVLYIFLLGVSLLPKLFVPWLGAAMFPLNGPAWSLFFEMIGNTAYATLVRFRLMRTRLFVAISIVSLIGLLLLASSSANLDAGHIPDQIGVGLLRVAYSFFLGVILYRVYSRRKQGSRIQGVPALLLSGAIAGVLMATLSLSAPLTQSQPFALFVIALLSPALVCLGSAVELSSRWTKLCAFLGDVSYPLYILHTPLYSPLTGRTAQHFASNHEALMPFAMVGYVSVLILFTWLIGKFFDTPVRKFLAARYKSPTRSHPKGVESSRGVRLGALTATNLSTDTRD